MEKFYQVAANFPKIRSILTYKSSESYEVGEMVELPLGRRKSEGVILSESTEQEKSQIEFQKLKSIEGKVFGSIKLDKKELELYKWMSGYYHYSLGKLIFDCLPRMMKRPKKIEFQESAAKDFPFSMTDEQAEVFKKINASLGKGFSRHYLHGVTGSGKSLVFLNLIKETLNRGQSAQFLLPEINLTPQFISMFQSYLGVKVYSYHSGVTPSEKYSIWKNLKESSEPVLVMGVRSSVFLPIQNLGLIIVDEEHDNSFKQADRCTYNGRDVAMKKCQIHGATFLMGSATPSVENYHAYSQELDGRHYYTLKNRVGDGAFSKIVPLDIRNIQYDDTWPLLPQSIEAIEEKLNKKEQVLVFINKLGYSSFLQCRACGYQFVNKACGCENNLRFFKAKNLLSCAHCDFKMPKPDECPECGNMTMLSKGFGTEKVESVLSSLFPSHRVERFDRDEIKNVKDLEDKLNRFQSGDIDILVGTQMLAKGHNFKKVNLVVMLGIDSMLSYADFRASERAYALCEQVAGRAGRYSKDGVVLIQTLSPEHPIFQYLSSGEFDSFYANEVQLREFCYCPPFSKLCMIYFSARFREKLIPVIQDVSRKLQSVSMEHFKNVKVYGPAPLMIEKKANQFTWALMLKSHDIKQLHQLIHTFENNYKDISGITVKIDIDSGTTL